MAVTPSPAPHKRQDKDDGLWHRAFQLPLPWERGQHKCFWDRFLELNLAPMPLPPVPGCSEDRQLPRLLQASPRSYTSISLDCALTTRVRSTCIAILGFENSRQSAGQVHKGNCMAPRLQLGYENFQMAPLL